MESTSTRVLLISDDQNMATSFTAYLEKQGLEASVTDYGELGLSEALSGRFCLALIDAMRSHIDGFELLRVLRIRSKLPVLMLTDEQNEYDRIIGLEMGADDSVAKSCTPRELLARIRAILRRVQESRFMADGRVITIGAMTIWPQRHTVAIDGSALHLTSTEFALLELLSRHAGAIVSKRILAEAVLGRRLSPYDRSIDVHISSIRQKLGDREDGLPWIQTIRGKGYQFIQE